jgi:hypothetical protein
LLQRLAALQGYLASEVRRLNWAMMATRAKALARDDGALSMRRKCAMQRGEQPPLFGMKRRPVVGGTRRGLPRAALSNTRRPQQNQYDNGIMWRRGRDSNPR